MDYDITIIGAGPAGLNASYYAAEHGVKVLILDKKQELGKPVRCGEAVIETVFKDFDIKPSPDIISNKVNCMKCISSKGKELSVESNLIGYILDRVKFEKYLGSRAVRRGVKIQLGTTVVGLDNNKNKIFVTKDHGKTKKVLKSKIIIGADGVESRVGRWSGIDTTLKPHDIAVCYQYVLDNLEIDLHTIEFYWGRKYSPHGYVWIFPKSIRSANVGIVTLGNSGKDLKGLLDKFIKTRFPNCKTVSQVAGCIPQMVPPAKVVSDNVMLIGDAARVAIPVTGAGIGHAMVSGKMAGALAGEVVAKNLGLEELSRFEIQMTKLRQKVKRAYRLKQKIIKDDDIFELLFGMFIPFQLLYKLSPKIIEKFMLKSLRY